MPILPNAKKAHRSSLRKKKFNDQVRARVKTTTDNMKADPTDENLSAVFSALDKALKRNIFHRNKVARRKRQMHELLKQAE